MRHNLTLASHRFSLRLLFVAALAGFGLLLAGQNCVAQQVGYMVAAGDSSVSLYDLTSHNLIEKINQGSNDQLVAVGPNSRLAYVSAGNDVSVIDLTLGHEIQRLRNLYPSPSGASITVTKDGKWLLVADYGNYTLDIVDAASFRLLRQVNLMGVMGQGVYSMSSVFVVGSKAYVTTAQTDFNAPAIAVVDLNTYAVKAIAVPAGELDFAGLGLLPDAAFTPDNRYLLMVQTNTNDFTYHMLFISTLTDKLMIDKSVSFEPQGVVITSSTNPAKAFGYLFGVDLAQGVFAAVVIDLRPGSQTYGQVLPSTEVFFSTLVYAAGAAISPDGSKLVISAFHASSQGPQPNAFVLDTGLMLTDPAHAIVAQTTVAGGAQTYAVVIAPFTTTPPATAPTVSGVSGSVVNNAATPIHVFGSNFASGATVRIGSMANLPATVNSSSDLTVTVPLNAPAAPSLDVLVTNPNTTSPPAQQNQSGVLSGGLAITVNPAFQPQNQFGSLNHADGSISVFDFTQRALTNIPLSQPAGLGLIFNFDGAELYSASNGARYNPNTPAVLSLKLSNDALTPISLPGTKFRGYVAIAASRNPFTGNPGVVYSWTSASGFTDVEVSMVDTNPASPTFNQVINNFFAGLNADLARPFSGTATPDGKYVYVDYYDAAVGQYSIAIFDIVHGGPATIFTTASLGILDSQVQMYVTPDGQSLLLNAASSGGIAVFDIGQNPKNPSRVTTISGTIVHGFLLSYQVVGTRLFALDIETNLLYAFNFDRQHSNFSRLGSYFFQGHFSGIPYLAVSPDGKFIYLPIGGDDMVSVYDANKLASGQPPLVTNLAAFHAPSVMAINPVSH